MTSRPSACALSAAWRSAPGGRSAQQQLGQHKRIAHFGRLLGREVACSASSTAPVCCSWHRRRPDRRRTASVSDASAGNGVDRPAANVLASCAESLPARTSGGRLRCGHGGDRDGDALVEVCSAGALRLQHAASTVASSSFDEGMDDLHAFAFRRIDAVGEPAIDLSLVLLGARPARCRTTPCGALSARSSTVVSRRAQAQERICSAAADPGPTSPSTARRVEGAALVERVE